MLRHHLPFVSGVRVAPSHELVEHPVVQVSVVILFVLSVDVLDSDAEDEILTLDVRVR